MGNSRSQSANLHEGRKYSEEQLLNNYQKLMVRTAWRHMSKSGQGNCGSLVMKRLFIKELSIKKVFQAQSVLSGIFGVGGDSSQSIKCGIQQHHAQIVQLLQYVVSNIDYPSKIAAECHKIGMSHRKQKEMGLKSEYWDMMGEAITETIREYHGWRRHRQSIRAANILVSFIVDRIRAGFNQRDALFAHLRPLLKMSVDPKALQTVESGVFSEEEKERKEIQKEEAPPLYRSRKNKINSTNSEMSTVSHPENEVTVGNSSQKRWRSIGVQTEREQIPRQRFQSVDISLANLERFRSTDSIREEETQRNREANDPTMSRNISWRRLPRIPATPVNRRTSETYKTVEKLQYPMDAFELANDEFVVYQNTDTLFDDIICKRKMVPNARYTRSNSDAVQLHESRRKSFEIEKTMPHNTRTSHLQQLQRRETYGDMQRKLNTKRETMMEENNGNDQDSESHRGRRRSRMSRELSLGGYQMKETGRQTVVDKNGNS